MSQNLNDLAKAFEFGSTYPAPDGASQRAYGGAPTSNLQQLVNNALQGVLGRSFRPGDHASFKAALDVSFEYTRVGDKDVYTHKPRAYPAVGATDIGGGISGAQFSLVSFAKGLHEKTQPLIDDLHTLDENVDDEELEAAKAIFSANWDEFVDELSREGGPRSSRADKLAENIFDSSQVPANLENAGSLIRLGVELGVVTGVSTITGFQRTGRIVFDRSRVVTIEEEGYLTNYIALTDYYFAVSQAWENYKNTFLGTDLGSGLLLIERSLAVVEDSVNEIYIAMDSVNVDQAERLIITVGFAGVDDSNLTVEDFLSWVHSFATREAPALIRDGGRLGIRAIVPTAEKLRDLTGEFLDLIGPVVPTISAPPVPARARSVTSPSKTKTPTTPSTTPTEPADPTTTPTEGETGSEVLITLPEQFSHARVRHPLGELQRYLFELARHANLIGA